MYGSQIFTIDILSVYERQNRSLTKIRQASIYNDVCTYNLILDIDFYFTATFVALNNNPKILLKRINELYLCRLIGITKSAPTNRTMYFFRFV